jgi:cytochrome-b5 reductase
MSSPFSAQYVTGLYLPSALLLIGVTAVKSEWLPYAVALTAVLAGWTFYSSTGGETHIL